jgi:VCBS repeat protein
MNTVEEDINPVSRWLGKLTIKLPHGVLMIGALALVFVLFYQAQKFVVTASRVVAAKQTEIQRATMSDEVSVHAAGRGNPWINLSDGHALITPYSGPAELTQILERNEARPLSLCSADFDEDGVPDLISGYAGPNGGIITLLRGNVDSIYPNSPEAQQRKAEEIFTDAPFLSPAFVFGVPEAPDFIGAGDFDGDGHWDVVTAARWTSKLYLMSGDGKGGLRETKRIGLPGEATAMIVGEINRSDGLDDIVVGIRGEAGAKALVFEGPEGALRAKPEEFALPAEATSLALGQLDDEYAHDLAIASDKELLIVHGRDRKLSWDAARQTEVGPAEIERRAFSQKIQSIAIGAFTRSQTGEIALLFRDRQIKVLIDATKREDRAEALLRTLGDESPQTPITPKRRDPLSPPSSVSSTNEQNLRVENNLKKKQPVAAWTAQTLAKGLPLRETQVICVRVSSSPVDSLLAIGEAADGITIVVAGQQREKRRVDAVDLNEETIQATLSVGESAVAVAPMRLNKDALSDLVVLHKGSTAPSVMQSVPQSILVVTHTNDSGPGSLRDLITQANNIAGADEIRFNIPGSAVKTISPLSPLPQITEAVMIDGYTQPATFQNSLATGNNVVLLIELNGSNAGAGAQGIRIQNGSSVVRGLVVNQFPDVGIICTANGNNRVEGCFIGTDASGTQDLGNLNEGIRISVGSSDNTIGGSAAAARNVISGNATGIRIDSANLLDSPTARNLLINNYIGTNAAGTGSVGNSAGVSISGSNSNVLGGSNSTHRNLISGNSGTGIEIAGSDGNGSSNLIQGNYIGTNIAGTSAISNGDDGIFLGTPNNTVGGTTTATRNLISGNQLTGVDIQFSSASANKVQGNYIGTNIAGTSAISNEFGIFIADSANNIVGGAIISARNLLSGNALDGILIDGQKSSGNLVQGNYIGTNATGTVALANGGRGIDVQSSSNNTLGGLTTVPGTPPGNLISGNNSSGINIGGNIESDLGPASNNAIQGNCIGTNAAGTAAIPNAVNPPGSSPFIIALQGGVRLAGTIDNPVGGLSENARNVISGNKGHGISVSVFLENSKGTIFFGDKGTIIQGNYIGTDISGASALGNDKSGILLDAGTVLNRIESSRIAFNGESGVSLPNKSAETKDTTGNAIIANQIYSNRILGIDIGNDGLPDMNDDRDLDTGPNNRQNYPVLLSASSLAGGFTTKGKVVAAAAFSVSGTFNSMPNSTFSLQFYFGSNCAGSGSQFTGFLPIPLGSLPSVPTDSNGNASFTFPFDFPSGVSSGFVNSTATDSTGSTSEFSECFAVTNVNPMRITSACKGDGKQLIINGSGFVDGAKVFLNGGAEKTTFVSSTQVIAFKAGKRAVTGDTLKVRNPDSAETPVVNYTRTNCSP